jgi:hypothetical protein
MMDVLHARIVVMCVWHLQLYLRPCPPACVPHSQCASAPRRWAAAGCVCFPLETAAIPCDGIAVVPTPLRPAVASHGLWVVTVIQGVNSFIYAAGSSSASMLARCRFLSYHEVGGDMQPHVDLSKNVDEYLPTYLPNYLLRQCFLEESVIATCVYQRES